MKVKAILDDLKIQFKALLSKKGKSPLIAKKEFFRRNPLGSPTVKPKVNCLYVCPRTRKKSIVYLYIR